MSDTTYNLPVLDTVSAAWAKVHGAKGTIWAVVGLFFIAQVVLAMLSNIPGLMMISNLVSWIVQIMAGGSLVYVGIRRAQDAMIQFGMIKDVLVTRTILCLIGVAILEAIILIPSIILSFLGIVVNMPSNPHAMPALAGVFYILAFIYAVIVLVRMWLANGFIVDKKSGPWTAIKLSFKATKGNFWNLVGLIIIKLFIALLCGITLGIGFIWGLPLLMIIFGEMYKRLVNSHPELVTA